MKLNDEEIHTLLYSWWFWARPSQLTPSGDWLIWLLQTGRGWGKTRTGAEWLIDEVRKHGAIRVAIIGRTKADVRDTMLEGDSGILSVSPPNFRPKEQYSRRRIVWPNGAIGFMYSADEPDQLRGPQHHKIWADEIAAWRNAYRKKAWDNAMFGLRLGQKPQGIVTTTPKPVDIVKSLRKMDTTVITRGSSYDNMGNLSPIYYKTVISPYEGTTLGSQEIHGELIEDVDGALWTQNIIDEHRIDAANFDKTCLVQIVVGVDPAASAEEESDETGIVVVGIDDQEPAHAYVLADLSVRTSPARWGKRAIGAYHEWEADTVVPERNNGGDMVRHTLATVEGGEFVPIHPVWASRGKRTRAEPISSKYEQGLVHHVGVFPKLEEQMREWVPGEKSPDRMDALVWACTHLMKTVNFAGPSVVSL
tara:strand:+ start:2062 stop:3321 length:1260 start_codon:yes stop_codon:yes gene_type:complete